jgi:hypothetical protein
MLLSHDKKFYFIHMPKGAGTSVRQALLPYCVQNRIWWKVYNPIAHRVLGTMLGSGRDKVPFTKHVTADAQLKAFPYLKDYFGFSFVRNPWDREVSLYHYILKANDHHKGRIVRSLGSFDAYIRWRKIQGKDRPQTRWTHDAEGNQLVNFIGRYECLREDFNELCGIIGISASLGHENSTAHRDYRSYYSDETAAIVESLYKKDCELFGYTFDPE